MSYSVANLTIGFIFGIIFLILLIFMIPSKKEVKSTKLWYGIVPCSSCKGSDMNARMTSNQQCDACKNEGSVLIYLDSESKPKECIRCNKNEKKTHSSSPLCYICGGTGWIGRVEKKERERLFVEEQKVIIDCPECGSFGEVEYEYDTGYTNNPEMMYVDCDTCKGSGSLFAYFDSKGKVKDCDWCRKFGEFKLEPNKACNICGGTAWSEKI